MGNWPGRFTALCEQPSRLAVRDGRDDLYLYSGQFKSEAALGNLITPIFRRPVGRGHLVVR